METQPSEVQGSEVTEKEAELDTKLVQLKLVTERSEKVLATGKRETTKRHVVNNACEQCVKRM